MLEPQEVVARCGRGCGRDTVGLGRGKHGDNCQLTNNDLNLWPLVISAETRLHRSESDSQLRSEGWPRTLTLARPESERSGEQSADWLRPGVLGCDWLREMRCLSVCETVWWPDYTILLQTLDNDRPQPRQMCSHDPGQTLT